MTEEGTFVKSPRRPDISVRSVHSTLWDTTLIVRAHGLRRALPLLILMVIAGFLDGIGVVSMLPVLAIVTGSDASGKPSMLQSLVEQGAAFLHLPLELEPLLALMAATIIAKAVLTLIVARRLGRAGARIAEELREQLIAGLMKAKWSYFTVQPVGRFVAAATSEANWASAAFRAAMRVLEQLTRTIILCSIAILMGWQMALIAIGMGVLTGLSLRSLSRAAYIAGRKRRLAVSRIVEEIGDIMAGFKPLKAMNRHARMFGELAKDARRLRKAVNALVLNEGLLAQLPDFVQITLFAICAYLAARLVGAPIETIVVAGVLSFALTGNVVRVRRALIQLAQAESTYNDLQDTIAEVNQAAEQMNGTQTPTLEIGCELRGVSFSYGRGPVLSGANMLVPARQITTLVGPSGIGKTTIADLLLGLYVPTEGTVLIDGIDITAVDIVKWRSMVGYVSQEIVLFNDTVLANVVLGDDAISEARVMSALEAAGLTDLIAELSNGLLEMIGERGYRLSGGQRQRLALARALVHRPKLLILDEATSALDPATEEEICSAIAAQAQAVTIFAITHQRSWIERSDNIYLVDNGKLRKVTREELRQVPVEAR